MCGPVYKMLGSVFVVLCTGWRGKMGVCGPVCKMLARDRGEHGSVLKY